MNAPHPIMLDTPRRVRHVNVSLHVPEGKRPLLRLWRVLLEQLADPDVDLSIDEVGPVVATWQKLRQQGHRFPFAVNVLVGKLAEQLNDLQRVTEEGTGSSDE